MSDISVIGLGKMGAALAVTLLENGYGVTVWNRSPDKAAALTEKGAHAAASLGAAVDASNVVIICVRNHHTSHQLLAGQESRLAGKVIIDLSTGGAADAEKLVEMLTSAGAAWLIGMINAFPTGIGQPETAILCAGPTDVWDRCGDIIRALGGASAHVGTTAASVPGLFAAMFTARQAWMFGLIYGGAVCRKAGLPLSSFAEQIPVTMGVAQKYAEVFMETVPDGNYDGANATVAVYRDALDDVMETFEATATADALPRLMRDLTQRAMDEGLQDKQLTALVELVAKS